MLYWRNITPPSDRPRVGLAPGTGNSRSVPAGTDGAETVMLLSLQERERLMIYTAARLAQERRDRGLRLNLPEATAIISSFLLEGARDGRTKAELQDAGRSVLRRDEVMDGVAEMLAQVQVEATFLDGTKLIAVQGPIQ